MIRVPARLLQTMQNHVLLHRISEIGADHPYTLSAGCLHPDSIDVSILLS